ncbi:MAG: hypothetical protein KGJ23_05870 [Euryarchaeota archaeon]|nr:hypothetical protein [Euryarchaeota archaeon]MDE1836126.1 hypothetical protein [Euryarchaeota archaeon]MDE1879416.1 hypothetical protein [Euryarchaeota archaeon]MDE2044104.1 hypothetical protein [Thermoplasmata archaeon]
MGDETLPPAQGAQPAPPPAADAGSLPRPLRPLHGAFLWALSTPGRRGFYYNAMRLVMIVGMLGLVTAVILPEITNTAQPAPDPLTVAKWLSIAPHNTTGLSGRVDGDDVVAGNFTVASPHGQAVAFDVLPSGNGNWSERMSQNLYPMHPTGASPVTFTAAYTDWYAFLWTNPSNSTVELYVDLSYLSSAPPA